jgi:hypothetical protein
MEVSLNTSETVKVVTMRMVAGLPKSEKEKLPPHLTNESTNVKSRKKPSLSIRESNVLSKLWARVPFLIN